MFATQAPTSPFDPRNQPPQPDQTPLLVELAKIDMQLAWAKAEKPLSAEREKLYNRIHDGLNLMSLSIVDYIGALKNAAEAEDRYQDALFVYVTVLQSRRLNAPEYFWRGMVNPTPFPMAPVTPAGITL